MTQVLTMFEKADAEFAELSQKKQILHLDKDKIEKVSQHHFVNNISTLALYKPYQTTSQIAPDVDHK